MNKKLAVMAFLTCLLTSVFSVTSFASNEEIKKPTPVFKQKFDWLKLTSDEWLKGDIVSMYDDELEFDSDNLDMQTIDWDDVAELRSKDILSIRMVNGTIAEGYLVVKDGKLRLVNSGVSQDFKLSQLLSIASSANNERDLWDGYINLGVNLRRGNTVQFDYTFTTGIQRRSSSGRFKTDYTANYSKYEDQDTNEQTITADSQRLTSTYDWFFSQKIFLRVMDFEYFSDEFINVDSRISYGIGVGYHIIDNSKTTLDINVGPSYQTTKFVEVLIGEDDSASSPSLVLGTDFTYEVTGDIDFDVSYQVKIVNEDSGEYLQHFQTGLEIDLGSDLDFDVTFYMDRTTKPKAGSAGKVPEKNDYRLVFSLGYKF